MKININNLKTEIIKLNTLIEEYEEIYLNLYNEISSCSLYWTDETSNKFFDNLNIEKLKVKNTITEMTDIKDIYEEVIRKYEIIGNKLEINPKKKNQILTKFNNYLDNMYELLDLYRELNLDFCQTEATKIYSHMDIIIEVTNNVVELKEKIKKQYEYIEEIEKTINLKISKIKIEYLTETDANKFI